MLPMLSSATKNTIKLTDHPLAATAVAIKLTAHKRLLLTFTLKIIYIKSALERVNMANKIFEVN